MSYNIYKDYFGLVNLISNPKYANGDIDLFSYCPMSVSPARGFLWSDSEESEDSIEINMKGRSHCFSKSADSLDVYPHTRRSEAGDSSSEGSRRTAPKPIGIGRPNSPLVVYLPSYILHRTVAIPITNNGKNISACGFCRNNGESQQFYSSHPLRDQLGSVLCPVLRAYTCPLCKTNGDNAHTITYCPLYSGSRQKKSEKVLFAC